jgi:hypothetical protein
LRSLIEEETGEANVQRGRKKNWSIKNQTKRDEGIVVRSGSNDCVSIKGKESRKKSLNRRYARLSSSANEKKDSLTKKRRLKRNGGAINVAWAQVVCKQPSEPTYIR